MLSERGLRMVGARGGHWTGHGGHPRWEDEAGEWNKRIQALTVKGKPDKEANR